MSIQREIFSYVSIVAFVTARLLLFVACDSRAPSIGICYGTVADNLPAPPDVVNLFKKNGSKYVRIYDSNPDILKAFKGAGISVTIGVKNADIPNFANNPDAATKWVDTDVKPYGFDSGIIAITVGNEVIPGPFAADVTRAMRNLKASLNAVGLGDVLVSTTVAFNLQTSFPPSAGAFPPDVVPIIQDVSNFLRENPAPLFVSIYPYFAYASNPQDISLEYATFNAITPVVDGQYQYFSLLDAQMDAFYAALARIGEGDVPIAIAETGWPTTGNEPYTSVANAQAYNTNLIKRVQTGKGPPRAEVVHIDAFIFATFDEDQKAAGIEQHWGVFMPNMEAKYPLTFF